jgi:CO/xanthine dehydrogenase Mo-binding subunit
MANDEMSKILELQNNANADKYPLGKYNSIGKRGVRRIDGYEKATGAAKYTIDVQLPGMLYARFLTSPYPHAEIKSMDTSKAEALPGVIAILRYDDPELPPVAVVGGHWPDLLPPLPKVAHFQGEEVGAFVAAESEEIAEHALRLIDVQWEERPFVLDPEEAMQSGAPLANPEENPDGNRYGQELSITKLGDVEKGFAEADKIIEFKFKQGNNTWIGPEVPCGVFKWNGDYPEVWFKKQHPQLGKMAIATWFGGIPMSKIQVHIPYQGASFGGWSHLPWCMGGHYCAAVVAKRTGRPVKWTFSRREDFYGSELDDGVYYCKVGAKLDGTITAVKWKTVLNNVSVSYPFHGHFAENTKIPNLYGETCLVKVNKGWTDAVRCEQNPNCHNFTMVFNHVADALGLDPIEVALKNDGAEGHDINWLNEQKAKMGFQIRDSLKECIEKGKAAIGWNEKWHAPGTKRLPNGKLHGLGFTWTHEWGDSSGTSEMAIRLERHDGTATILGCRADIGVNAETAYCQIAADELGMCLEDVHYNPQIDAGFFTMTPDQSTNMSVNGFAIRNAARLLKRSILEAAVSPRGTSQLGSAPPTFPGLKPEDLDIKDSVIYEKANPSNRITMAEFVGPVGNMGPMGPPGDAMAKNLGEKVPPRGEPPPGEEFAELLGQIGSHSGKTSLADEKGTMFPFTAPLFEGGWQVQLNAFSGVHLRLCRQAHFMEVEVDDETGEVKVTKVVNVNDVGKVINWDGCEGQQYGGTFMGVGRGKTEELVHDKKTGVMLNGNLLNYKIQTMNDIGPIDTILVETGMGYGPYGLVGIAEDIAADLPTIIGPAVHNAIGKWVEGFPITLDKVLKALGKT